MRNTHKASANAKYVCERIFLWVCLVASLDVIRIITFTAGNEASGSDKNNCDNTNSKPINYGVGFLYPFQGQSMAEHSERTLECVHVITR